MSAEIIPFPNRAVATPAPLLLADTIFVDVPANTNRLGSSMNEVIAQLREATQQARTNLNAVRDACLAIAEKNRVIAEQARFLATGAGEIAQSTQALGTAHLA